MPVEVSWVLIVVLSRPNRLKLPATSSPTGKGCEVEHGARWHSIGSKNYGVD